MEAAMCTWSLYIHFCPQHTLPADPPGRCGTLGGCSLLSHPELLSSSPTWWLGKSCHYRTPPRHRQHWSAMERRQKFWVIWFQGEKAGKTLQRNRLLQPLPCCIHHVPYTGAKEDTSLHFKSPSASISFLAENGFYLLFSKKYLKLDDLPVPGPRWS